MITTEQIREARINWLKASQELKFKIITPYMLSTTEIQKEVFAYLPEYGSPYGTIVELTAPPEYHIDKNVSNWAKANKFFYSCINVCTILDYSREYFKEILDDWTSYKHLKN